MALHQVEPFQPFRAGDLHIIPLLANHSDRNGAPPLNYIIERDGGTILYALDSGWFHDESLAEIRKHQYDLMVVEGTFAKGVDMQGHNNFAKAEKGYDLFRRERLLKKGALFCISHTGPHVGPVHDEIAPIMAAKGITVAYDGLCVDL